ncbi:hypothetical protein GIB67_038912 [Kingdonia uniflora]|uniref:Phagocyte signaling-impaired protein n=1 Tax=Kingdonia uniflora TaxID=39325 RepID=A0A7J7LQ90_9MAGN|nr:hypothetical protein GIB67_038912 [Kingdonia uniflora]
MSSRFGMAGGIPERRVRPIWDAVDSRQFKSALKLSTSLLSKYPNSPYAIALKALILERMGKVEEALSVCLTAKERLYSDKLVFIDDLTLSTLQIVFQRLGHLDFATSCYEYACGKFPNNVDLMMGLFNCYVREYSYVKQQQTAIKMYKTVVEERFLLWAVCSIQLQVSCGNGEEKLLLLAEGLLKKHVVSHSLHEPEALLVYISVLEQQAKYGAALELLSGKMGSLLVIEVDKLYIQGRLLARSCDYVAAAEIFKKVMEICPDDWENFLNFLGCLLEDDSRWCNGMLSDQIHRPRFVDCKLSHLADEVFDTRVSIASDFVETLQTNATSDSLRCPYLAKLEIERRKHLYGTGDTVNLKEALLKYFCRFGHLACFATDVEMFFQVLSPDERTQLLTKFIESCEPPHTAQLKVLGKSITIFKIRELIGTMFRLPVNKLERAVKFMAELYCQNLSLSKDLDPQENMPGEDLLSLASNVLVQLFWRTRLLGYLLEAVMVLEYGLTIRRYSWQYKVLLVHLYSHLSALPLAYEWYKTLEIKNIMLETVSHHILPQMLISPLWVDSSDILKDYLKFMDDHFKESADLTFLAYRHRNYSKAVEFVEFKERLQHSHQYWMARIEAPILQLKQKADNIDEEECVLENMNSGIQLIDYSSEERCKALTFNEDMQSRPWWTPSSDKNYLLGPFEEDSIKTRENLLQQQQTTEREVRARIIIQIRALVPRLIYLSIQSASSSLKETLEANDSIFDDNMSLKMKSLLECYARSLGLAFNDAVKEITSIANGQKSLEVSCSSIIDWMNFAVFVGAWKLSSREPSSPDGDSWRPGSLHIVDNFLKKFIIEKLKAMKPLTEFPGNDLLILVQMVTEPLAWHSLVIQSCIRASYPSGKRKKKSGPTTDLLTSPLFQAIQGSIESLRGTLEELTKFMQDQINASDDEILDKLFAPFQRKGCSEGPGQIIHILEDLASGSSEEEHGDRIARALHSWSSIDCLRKILVGQRKVLTEFELICESKLKLLQTLKLQM